MPGLFEKIRNRSLLVLDEFKNDLEVNFPKIREFLLKYPKVYKVLESFIALELLILHWTFYIQIKGVWLFASTRLGYAFYLITVTLVVGKQLQVFFLLGAVLLITFLIGSVLELLLLTNLSPSRRFLDRLLGANFIREHLGNRGIKETIKILSPAVGIIGLDFGAVELQRHQHYEYARTLDELTRKSWNEDNYTPSREERNVLLKQVWQIADRPALGLEGFFDKIRDYRKVLGDLDK